MLAPKIPRRKHCLSWAISIIHVFKVYIHQGGIHVHVHFLIINNTGFLSRAHVYPSNYNVDQEAVHVHYHPLLIRRIKSFLKQSRLPGEYIQLNCCHYGALQGQPNPTTNSALTGTHLLLRRREAIVAKCLAQGHRHRGRGRDLNPHSDDTAIGTQIKRCNVNLQTHAWNINYTQHVLCAIAQLLCNNAHNQGRHKYAVRLRNLKNYQPAGGQHVKDNVTHWWPSQIHCNYALTKLCDI